MCGICGIYKFNRQTVELGELRAITDRMRHRGPDDEGFSVRENIGIGMRRLSIIDIEGGDQPIANEDGSIEVVMNGEIYNYIELRDELIRKGHRLKTHSDTEVLVHLYEDEGKEFLPKINGMFSFIIWDKTQNSFWVVRDRIGIKPLYYSSDGKKFICASDLNALREALPERPRISREGFLGYLVMGYVPGTLSIYENVQKLQPGYWLEIKDMEITSHQYWDIRLHHEASVSIAGAQEQLRGLLKDAIRLQKRSDVPIGTFLSGGIDSSSIVALLSQESAEPVRTFTADFAGKDHNESPFARMIVERYKTRHFEKLLKNNLMAQLLEDMMPLIDEPIADSAMIPSYFLSRMAREQGVKVLLNGTGGDELFGGYLRHHPYAKGSKYWFVSRMPGFLRRSLSILLKAADDHLALALEEEWCYWGTSISGIDLGVLKTVLSRPGDFDRSVGILKQSFSNVFAEKKHSYFSRMRHDFTNYLVGDVLSLLDKTTMACSIEGRVPLLDHRIAEFAFGIPETVNVLNGQPKGLLKSVVKEFLPKEILERPKIGFNAPVESLMNDFLRDSVASQFNDPNDFFKEILDIAALKNLVNKNQKLSARFSETLFSLYIFDRWYKVNY